MNIHFNKKFLKELSKIPKKEREKVEKYSSSFSFEIGALYYTFCNPRTYHPSLVR